MTAPDTLEPIPRRIGPYDIVGRIAGGGMADVFAARGPASSGIPRVVAVKQPKRDAIEEAKTLDMFLDESRLASRVKSPHCVETYEIGLDDEGKPYLVMPFVIGLYTKGKSYPRTDYKCEKPGLFEHGELAILTDEGSASASEILAGAVQDWDRGVIIGRRTFGKGLVQEQFDLSNGGALRLTVARYYIPSGRSIQKSYSNGRDAYDEDIVNRFNHGEFLNRDSIKPTDTIPYKTAKGRIVYGGGGITPDIFIPFDTSRFSPALTELYTRNTFSDFAYNYYNNHQDELKRFKDAGAFNKQFQVSNDLYGEFREFARKDSIHQIDRLTAKDETEIRNRIKAVIARQLWRTEGYYEVSNAFDPLVKRAVEELK